MATRHILFSIPSKSRNEIKVTNIPEVDFYKIEFEGRTGYIYKTRLTNK